MKRKTHATHTFGPGLPFAAQQWRPLIMEDHARESVGWVVTVTTPDPLGATAKVWYAACPEKGAAVEAVKLVTPDSSATIEISREMSETLMTAFGLTNGQVKCFD